MKTPPRAGLFAVATAAIAFLGSGSLAAAATLVSITVSPPSLDLRPCETATLEITGHYDDGSTSDLSNEPGVAFTFAAGNATRRSPDTIEMTGFDDDSLIVSLDGVDGAPVDIHLISPSDLSLCTVVGGTTTTTTAPDPPTTSSTSTTTTTTTTTTAPTPTSSPTSSTTTTTDPPPPDPDAACSFCVHDRIQHRFRIENHVIFHAEQTLQDRCAAVEFPRPVFKVAADGTQSSIFDVTQVVEGTCQTTLTDPNPHFLDDNFDPIDNPDRDTYGAVFAVDRRPGYVRFQYTHPRTPPDDGDAFRTLRIGIFYTDRRNPGAGERLVTVMEVHVYRTPVLLVHGLWSDSTAFDAMEQSLEAFNYEPSQIYRLDYRNTNDSAFSINYPQVVGAIDATIGQAVDADIAAGKTDIVTHSMGGVLGRLYLQSGDYGHDVRRLITCNTPHAGSQMANLLLDRTFDPFGLLCQVMSTVMSTDSVPNRGCYNGAVGDMRVNSFATTHDLNGGIHPDDVAVHALATVMDPADVPVVPVVAGSVLTGPMVIANLLRACGLSLVDAVFDHDDSDLIVSATSQAGGLSGPLTSLFPDQQHMGSTANPAVIDRVEKLLNEPDGSSSFTRSGYSPSPLPYTSPSSVCPLPQHLTRLGAARDVAATSIAITSPASGTTVTAGDVVGVDVSGSGDVATVLVLMSQPGSDILIAGQPAPTAHVDLTVPQSAIGPQHLVAAGVDVSGRLVAVSDAVDVDVAVPASLTAITVYPPVVYLRPCGSAALEVTGRFDDGVTRNLSDLPELSMAFESGNAARVAGSALVLNQPAGDAVVVSVGAIESARVPIRVLAPDELSLCATSTTTTTLPGDTTTTTPGSSTTTSTTLPPACTADAGCDDADACTSDLCTAAGCEHAVVQSAGCLLGAALDQPLCPADTIDPKFETYVTDQLRGALDLVQKAAVATKPKKQQSLLAKAARKLGKIAKHKPGTTSAECLEAVDALVDEIVASL